MIFKKRKDGGNDSHVWGYFLELKRFFTIALLCFEPGTREAYHNHAFNCFSIILGPGYLEEEFKDGGVRIHKRFKCLVTRRDDFHKVYSHGRTWVLTIRGPWSKTWQEYSEREGLVCLTHGREKVNDVSGN